MTSHTPFEKPKTKPHRLLLPWHHPAVIMASMLWWGHLPNTRIGHLGSFGMSLLTPFLLSPLLPNFPLILLIAAVANFAGAWAVVRAEAFSGGVDHDARAVVIDEFVGAALSLVLAWALLGQLPGFLGGLSHGQSMGLLLFIGLCFRVCDLAKPFPAKWFDRHWHHPYSIMADDIVAGVYGGVLAALPFWLMHLLA